LAAHLTSSGFSYRRLFLVDRRFGFLSLVAGNLTTASVMCAVSIAVGWRLPASSCCPASISSLPPMPPARSAHSGTSRPRSCGRRGWHVPGFLPPACAVVTPKIGTHRMIVLFGARFDTAVCVHTFVHLPPALGMMSGLGYLCNCSITCLSAKAAVTA